MNPHCDVMRAGMMPTAKARGNDPGFAEPSPRKEQRFSGAPTERRVPSYYAGQAMHEALLSATSIRLRPILMTAATTIFALIPVAVNPAVGSRIFQPFATTVIGGLASATAATLLLVPALRASLPQKQ